MSHADTASATFRAAALALEDRVDLPSARFLVSWVVAWGAIGVGVGVIIGLWQDGVDLAPVLGVSIPFAEVVGLTALASSRLVFPLLVRRSAVTRFALQVVTLVSGALFGSLAVLLANPLFTLARPRAVALIFLTNAILAVVTGLALYTYEGMKRQIEASYRALREKEALEREVAIAREVQRELLPRDVPEVEGLELAGFCRPAVGVGGDFYDFVPAGRERVGLVVGDVAGKGIPAALLMAGIQASMRSLAMPDLPPRELFGRLNRTLSRSISDSRYATLFFAWFDGGERSLTYCNAGHLQPIVVGRSGRETLPGGGRPIGMLDDSSWEQESRRLDRGDLLALFTDGIVEAPAGSDGEEFGVDRLAGVLEASRELDLEALLVAVDEAVSRWTAGAAPHDDRTLVLARAR